VASGHSSGYHEVGGPCKTVDAIDNGQDAFHSGLISVVNSSLINLNWVVQAPAMALSSHPATPFPCEGTISCLKDLNATAKMRRPAEAAHVI